MSRLRATTLRVIGPGLLILIGVGCATVLPITGPGKHETWIIGADPTRDRTQSETAIASGYGPNDRFITVTYNDETGTEHTILYTSTSRTVLKGASMMGWSFSMDHGQTWNYGGKVLPDLKDWFILWGDPAITAFPNKYVFLSNVAVHSSKYPPGGVPSEFYNPDGSSPIGGACIARSTDVGVTFKMYQCLSTADFDFYDAGSMGWSLRGEIFAAYLNVTHDRIDVWRSPSPDGQFTQLPDPFPGLAVVGHPLLRVALQTGDLYVMVADLWGILYINRFVNGAWQQRRVAGFDYKNSGVKLSDRTMRVGPWFSFDIGASEIEDGRDAVRVLYTVQDPRDGRLRLAGSMCRADLRENCNPAPGWSTNLPGDQFMPNVRAWSFLWFPYAWKATFVSREEDPDGNTVLVRIGDLVAQSNGLHGFPTHKLLDPQVVCSDLRGYWGDYNDLQYIEAGSRFLYTFSDSRAGCPERSAFTSKHLHVLGVVE